MKRSSARSSTNAEKYGCRDSILRWHRGAVMGAIYRLVEQTGSRSVLDAGCGKGFVTRYLADQDPTLRLTGVDVRQEAIAFAQDKFSGVARFQTGSLYKLPFSDNSFDAVVCSEVLEYVHDVDRALQELKRVSRRYVLITAPNEPYYKWANDFARAIRFGSDPGHVNFWTHQAFKAVIRKHFQVLAFERKHVIYQLALAGIRDAA